MIDPSPDTPPSPPPDAPGRRFWTGVALATTAAAALRLWRLDAQVLGGDELHAVRVALAAPWREILTTYHLADNCIPLTALDRLLMDLGVPLSERWLRAPMLLAGLLAPPLLGLAVARRLSRAAGAFFAALLALSPLLVLYSRIARPYMPAVLLVGLAAFAGERFLRTGERRAALGYVVAAGLAVWFLLPALPAAVAPAIWGGLDAFLRRGADRRIRMARALGLASGLALVGLALLGPTLPSLLQLAEAKRVAQDVPIGVWGEALRLHCGSVSIVAGCLVAIAALGGLAALARRNRDLAALSLMVVVTQGVGLRALSPIGLGNSLILARYLLPALPFVLLWIAAGLGELWRAARFPLKPVAVVALGALLAGSPLWRDAYRRTSFLGHNDFVCFTRPPAEAPLPRCYAALGGLPPGAVLELPWPATWAAHLPYLAERVHARPVILGVFEREVTDPRLALRTLRPATPAAAVASGAAVLVVHVDPTAEERAVTRGGGAEPFRFPQGFVEEAQDLTTLLHTFDAALGPPACVDDAIRVWDLTVRRSSPPA